MTRFLVIIIFIITLLFSCFLPVISFTFLPSTLIDKKFSTSLSGQPSQTKTVDDNNNHDNSKENINHNHHDHDVSSFRRRVLKSCILMGGYNMLEILALSKNSPITKANAVERALGSAERECQEAGNCLERGEWDAAVGWNWGGKDRCDATDPQCGPNGRIRPTELNLAVPSTTTSTTTTTLSKDEEIPKITHVVELTMTIGRKEQGTLRMGLYGTMAPEAVQQLVDFVSPQGLITTPPVFGYTSRGVSLCLGGIVTNIVPSERIQFGVPSQSAAYARFMGLSKAGDLFIPQKPQATKTKNNVATIRPHDCAGLISIPAAGLGTMGGKNDDEAFANGTIHVGFDIFAQ
jgi:cyclophilin family peptidyl-prolyl cis-trans isomerase